MTAREKKLGLAVGLVILLFVLFLGLRALLVLPLKRIDRDITSARVSLKKLKDERRAYFAAEDALKGLVKKTFSPDPDIASARSGELLTRLILQAGLDEAQFSRLPLSPRYVRGGGTGFRGAVELGWSVQGEGRLQDLVDLLYLLEASPFLHHIDNLYFAATSKEDRVKVRFRYLTLVITDAPEVELPAQPPPTPDLDTPERRRYALIVTRNLLRPFTPPPPTQEPPPQAPPPVEPAAPGPETFRVVSLSEWNGQPEIHVRDLTQNVTRRYRPGDELGGGVIAMVDYRALPMPGHPGLKSFSRVIIRIDDQYWAVERGGTLADKHLLPADQLPEQLSKL